MDISFLLLNVLTGRQPPKNGAKTPDLPQNNMKQPQRSDMAASVQSKKASSVRGGDLPKNHQKITNEIPIPCDTVEISHTAEDFNTAASAGHTGAFSDIPYSIQGSFSHSGKPASRGATGDSCANVLTALGAFLVIVSFFILPKGLLLTAVGVLICISGIRMRFGRRQ